MIVHRHIAVRYVEPLREGGSLPALLETEDGSLFVAKFRGAGQGAPPLVAELIAGLLAHHLGLPVPEVAVLHLDESFGRTERDPEIQDILKSSRGLNVGLRFLEGALNFNLIADADVAGPDLAADIVWFDAYILNVDRTPRNPNLLVWNEALYLIDHGSSLYLHYDWASVDEARIRSPFPVIRDHVLLPAAGNIEQAQARLTPLLNDSVLEQTLALVPDDLLLHTPQGRTPAFATADAARSAYLRLLSGRLEGASTFTGEAERARRALNTGVPRRLSYRR